MGISEDSLNNRVTKLGNPFSHWLTARMWRLSPNKERGLSRSRQALHIKMASNRVKISDKEKQSIAKILTQYASMANVDDPNVQSLVFEPLWVCVPNFMHVSYWFLRKTSLSNSPTLVVVFSKLCAGRLSTSNQDISRTICPIWTRFSPLYSA